MLQLAPTTLLFTSHFLMQNSVVTGTSAGSACIDPAYFPDEIDAIRREFLQQRRQNNFLLFTHGDFDHVLGLGRDVDAITVIQQQALALDHEQIAAECRQYDAAAYLTREPPFTFPRIERTFISRLDLSAEGIPLLLVHTPGHTADSAVILHLEQGWAHVGDMLSDIEFPIVRDSFRSYRSSLELLPSLFREYGTVSVIPGHGHLAADRAEAERRRARDLRYLDNVEHRLRDLVPAGADLRRCLSRMKDIRVGGEPIPPYLREFHEGNVALIYYELLTGPK